MKPRKSVYLVHRWLGLVVSVQLLAWSSGGFIFSVLEIGGVRGEQDAAMREFVPLDPASIATLPEAVAAVIAGLDPERLASVALVDRGLGAHWEIRDPNAELLARLDLSGTSAGLLTPDQAASIAERDFLPDAPVESSDLLNAGDEIPVEYRGKPLPAYRVVFDHPKRTHVYVDATTGAIAARRNRSWRIFDFFWMLHTMDYAGRDDFNHPLLTGASVLAILTSATGLSLWAWRLLPGRKQTRSAAA